MANNIPLTSGIRSNLLLLQQTSSLLEKTQLRLATGNKINSALDGPAAFFAAKGLTQRAGDLDGLKDGIGQAISTIKAGDSGITAIEAQIEQARGLTTQALGALGNDANSVKLRNSLAQQYNNVLRQIDKLAQDSGYQGKNLLVGSGLRVDATASSKSEVNALTGISGARATNVVESDTYAITVVGDGAITGNSNDIANAERDRGISNVEVTGFASKSAFNFDSISIKLAGGTGKDKTFTITEGTSTVTQTFTNAQADAAEAAGTVLRFSASFASGTRVSFDIDFNAIEDVADTAGVGTSVIEKNVNLQVVATNENGEAVTRDGLSALGSGKVANGENAFAFDSGTARITLDERQILGASSLHRGGQFGLWHRRSGLHLGGDRERHCFGRRDDRADRDGRELQLRYEHLRQLHRGRHRRERHRRYRGCRRQRDHVHSQQRRHQQHRRLHYRCQHERAEAPGDGWFGECHRNQRERKPIPASPRPCSR